MKLAILACLATVAMAAPQLQQGLPVVQVLRDERQQDDNGNFNYALETDNGIYMAASGVQGSQGQINIEGSYRLPSPTGGFEDVRYVADEFGFRAESSLLPTSQQQLQQSRQQFIQPQQQFEQPQQQFIQPQQQFQQSRQQFIQPQQQFQLPLSSL